MRSAGSTASQNSRSHSSSSSWDSATPPHIPRRRRASARAANSESIDPILACNGILKYKRLRGAPRAGTSANADVVIRGTTQRLELLGFAQERRGIDAARGGRQPFVTVPMVIT